jgi:hypothetical protein
MKYLLLWLFFFLFIWNKLIGQPPDFSEVRRNGTYIEAYLFRHDFSDGFVSFNYERILGFKRKTNLRIGIYPDFETSIAIPITVSWITNSLAKNHFEFGLGFVYRMEFFRGDFFQDIPAAMFPIMYRYQKNKGFFFRIGVNVFVSFPTLISPSLSLGYKF